MIRSLGGGLLLVQYDYKGFELLELGGSLANQVHLDFSFEASIEGGGKDLFVGELQFQDDLVEGLCIPVNGAGLLDAGVESVLGLLL